MKYIITENQCLKMINNSINENNWTEDAKNNIDNIFNSLPKLKDLKPYGLKYSVKSLKNLLIKKLRPDGTYGDKKWVREEMPFPEEMDILNLIFQSRLSQFYFTKKAKDKGKHHYDWAHLINKEDLDNFPIPESVFNTAIDILTKTKHRLDNLSEEEKNHIREQHTGVLKIMVENFGNLINHKLGDVKPLVNEVRNKENDRNKIYQDENIVVVAPLTHRASCKYGANTKWCTSVPSNDEHFKEHMEHGVLIYFIIRSPHKNTKKTEYKFAYYHPFDDELIDSKGWYDMSDNQIDDNVDMNLIKFLIPDEIFKLVKEYIKTQRPVWKQKMKQKSIDLYEKFITDPDNMDNVIVNDSNWLITYRIEPFNELYDGHYVYQSQNSNMTIFYVNKKTKEIYTQNLDYYVDLRNFINGEGIEKRTGYDIKDLNGNKHSKMSDIFKKYYPEILKSYFKVRKEMYHPGDNENVYIPPQYLNVGDEIGVGRRSDVKIHKIYKDPKTNSYVIDGIDSKGNISKNMYYNREIGMGIKYDKEKHNPM